MGYVFLGSFVTDCEFLPGAQLVGASCWEFFGIFRTQAHRSLEGAGVELYLKLRERHCGRGCNV